MLALRHFKALCCFGVFLGGLSFLFSIVAIATTPWFVAEEVSYKNNGVTDQNTTVFTNASNENTTTAAPNVVVTTTTEISISLSGLWYICSQQATGKYSFLIVFYHVYVLF